MLKPFLIALLSATLPISAFACNNFTALSDMQSGDPETRIGGTTCARTLRNVSLDVQLKLFELLGDSSVGQLKGLPIEFWPGGRQADAQVYVAAQAALVKLKLDSKTLPATLEKILALEDYYAKDRSVEVLWYFASHGYRAELVSSLANEIEKKSTGKGLYILEKLHALLSQDGDFFKKISSEKGADRAEVHRAMDTLVNSSKEPTQRNVNLLLGATRAGYVDKAAGFRALSKLTGQEMTTLEQAENWTPMQRAVVPTK
jgi:hypothetical protein